MTTMITMSIVGGSGVQVWVVVCNISSSIRRSISNGTIQLVYCNGVQVWVVLRNISSIINISISNGTIQWLQEC